MDIVQHEYIPDVGQSAGAVVVVHNSDVMPFPEDEGILALPGRMTNVAFRRVSHSSKLGFCYPIQQPGSYCERPSALPPLGVETHIEVTVLY